MDSSKADSNKATDNNSNPNKDSTVSSSPREVNTDSNNNLSKRTVNPLPCPLELEEPFPTPTSSSISSRRVSRSRCAIRYDLAKTFR